MFNLAAEQITCSTELCYNTIIPIMRACMRVHSLRPVIQLPGF